MTMNAAGMMAMVRLYSGSWKWTSTRLYWMMKLTRKKKSSLIRTR